MHLDLLFIQAIVCSILLYRRIPFLSRDDPQQHNRNSPYNDA